MNTYPAKNIINVAMAGHSGAGKTSLAEAMLYLAGASDRRGKVGEGNTVCDSDPEEIRRKTTRNGSMMAYVTVEDDTGSMELLTFSTILGQYGSLLYENSPVILNGRISVRDEKPPQMVVNRVVQIGDMKDLDAAQAARQTAAQAHTVYLKIESSAQRSAKKVLPILKMFPGKARAVIYFADTGARMGGSCALDERMLQELREQLGEKNVVVK